MKRTILLLLGATSMTIASLVSSAVAAPPAAAGSPTAVLSSVGYIVSCFTGPIQNLPLCLRDAVRQLLLSVHLPINPVNNNSLRAPTPASGSTTPPALNLPSTVSPILKSLPGALQTAPLANAPEVLAPIRQLVPTKSATKATATAKAFAKLPQAPTVVPINLATIADSKPEESSVPVSAADLALLAGLGALGFLGVQRSRAAKRLARR